MIEMKVIQGVDNITTLIKVDRDLGDQSLKQVDKVLKEFGEITGCNVWYDVNELKLCISIQR